MTAAMDPDEARALRRSVKLDRYAEILAHVVHFGDGRAEAVARRFGLSLDAWKAVDAAWISELGQGIRRRQAEQGLRFSATFARIRERLAREQPALETVGDTASKPGAGPRPEPLPAPATAVPSFMAAPAAAPVMPSFAAMAAAAPPPRLPLEEQAEPETAARSAVEQGETAKGPGPAKPVIQGITSTVDGDLLAAVVGRVLPFQGGAPAKPGAPVSPPAAPAPAPASALSLEQYALVHAELSLNPDQRAHILRRFHLTPETHGALDAEWQAKITQDPSVRAAWEHARSHYEKWLRQQVKR